MTRARTIGTLFSGGEGVGVGARAAGIEHAWGIENDPDIADVARMNGFDVTVADVTECNPADFAPVDILHASPPCPSFSLAKTGGNETKLDIALAQATARFICSLQPSILTLENVYAYRKSESWRIIATALHDLGYPVLYWHLNAADYGVPQTRKRMIVIALRDGREPKRPKITHGDPAKIAPFFDNRLPWVGWYEAIEDLIPSLPESQFAPWQLERLPAELLESILMPGYGNTGFNTARPGKGARHADEPATTVPTLASGGSLPKAFLVDSAGYLRGDGRVPVCREQEEPANTIVANHARRPMRAFIVGDQEGQIAGLDRPAFTVRAGENGGALPRAFIVDCQNAGSTKIERSLTIRQDNEPMYTLTGSMGPKRPSRDFAHGRVVRMTPRCLARFQAFPDSYVLPESNTLACRVIGNSVPPLLYQKIVAQYS